ncbi:putative bifunctional Dihydrofolate/Folylpolyglutamate synthase [Prochlorococcus marinus str. MIT 9515]|uniref:Putative bifunctional Dihydrofolate/Folylpolyglutamate synthase n=1 Tax=Prochlorococcus marinus (strain MIT 9515) TaxID=167542 RepID=A2BY09_PROM5|nr:Mur ligase family protein [Prochlorococcus marinus]ABM72670.1 putative bifunctional Dihydrofolate/Folylpolyglutamate synthase [Prochlorococcus marinus str. MIT 9515]
MKKENFKNFDLLSPKFERQNIHLGLSRIKKALKKLNDPCKNIPAIQVVGTNGKGSITAFIENILYEEKKNIGVTTSPHLLDICERIRVNKENIHKEEFESLFKKIATYLSIYKLSPFEQIICCALVFFDMKKVDLLILEAGLGGRLDATTAHNLRPIIAIGNIDLDHKEYLGDSIEKITKEKVAVIEKNAFVISFRQKTKVEEIIKARAKKVGAQIIWKESLSNEIELGLNGAFQRQNAAVAIGVIEALNNLGFNVRECSIKEGLKNTKWNGRLEIINCLNKKILVDSAHNYSAAMALSEERKTWNNQEEGVYWILGVQKSKDIVSMLKVLIKKNDHILLVPVPNQTCWRLEDLLDNAELENLNIIDFEKIDYAFNYLLELRTWPKCHPVLTGSIFLVSEFIKFANNQNY